MFNGLEAGQSLNHKDKRETDAKMDTNNIFQQNKKTRCACVSASDNEQQKSSKSFSD